MRQRVAGTEATFRGLSLNHHRSKLPPGLFSADAGSSHERQGTSWLRRRGQALTNMRTTIAAAADGSARVKAVLGAALGGERFAVLTAQSTNAYGYSSPDTGTGDNAASTLSTALTAATRPDGCVFRRQFYVADGWRFPKRWDGLAAATVTAGIAGPSRQVGTWAPAPTTAAGSTTVGTHLFRYRYQDSVTGYVSDPSNDVSLTVAAGAQQLTFPIDTSGAANMIRSTDTKVDRIVIEMTEAGGTAFFVAVTALNSASSAVVSISDVSLRAPARLPWPDDGFDVPPVTRWIVSHRSRIWAFGQVVYSTGTIAVTNGSTAVTGTSTDWTTDALGTSASPSRQRWFLRVATDARVYEVSHVTSGTAMVLKETYAGSTLGSLSYQLFVQVEEIFYSRADFPEAFPFENAIPPDEGEQSGAVTAGVGYGDRMLFFTKRSMFELVWTTEPSVDGRRVVVGGNRGAIGQRVVVAQEARVYAMDRLGFHYYEGVFPTHISRPVDDMLEDVNWSASDQFFAVFLPRLRAVRWYVCMDSDSYPKDYFQYEVDTGIWSTGELQAALTDAKQVPTADGTRVLAGDYYGMKFWLDEGDVEGGQEAHARKTVGAGSTNVGGGDMTLVVEGTLPTTGDGIRGAYVYWRQGEEWARIHSNTATTIVLNNAIGKFTALPGQGDELLLGAFTSKLKTRAFVPAQGAKGMHRGRYLALAWDPLTAPTGQLPQREILVRAYENLSATSKSDWGRSAIRDDARGVVSPASGETDWTLDPATEAGVARIGLGDQFVRALEVEIELIESDCPLEIRQLEIDGLEVEAVT